MSVNATAGQDVTPPGDGARPVVVLGADSATGLTVARALRGVAPRIIGIALDCAAPTCASSAWDEVVVADDASDGGWLEAMARVARSDGRAVVIPARDDTVALLSAHASQLGEHFDVVLPGPEVVTTLLDKTVFHRWASERSLPVPRSEVVSDPDELARALERLAFPVILKPYERTAAWQRRNQRRKAFRLDRAADVDTIPFALFDLSPRYVLQEWVPGYDSDVYFCLVYRDRHGHELAHQAGRKLLQWPIEAGNTVVCTTTEDGELHALTSKLLDAAGAVGLASLEVKRSRTDGRLYIIEPTVGRPNLQSGLATAAGPNLLAIAYRDACGLPQTPRCAPRRASWVHESTFWPALFTALRSRRLDVRALASVLRGRPVFTAAFFGRGDSAPLLREMSRQGRQAVRALRNTDPPRPRMGRR